MKKRKIGYSLPPQQLALRLAMSGAFDSVPDLQLQQQAVDKAEHGFIVIHINTLRETFAKTNDILGNTTPLGPFCERLAGFEGIICRLEISQHSRL